MSQSPFLDEVAKRSAPDWKPRLRTRRQASSAEFEAAMAPRRWSEARLNAAFRVLVLGEKFKDTALAVGLSKDNVSQACDQAYAAIKAWRLVQVTAFAEHHADLEGLAQTALRLLAQLNAASDATEAGELKVALNRAATHIQHAIDELSTDQLNTK